jgi:hypothetical protein
MTSSSVQNPFELVSLMALLKHNVPLYLTLARLHAPLTMFKEPLPGSDKVFVPDLSSRTEDIKKLLETIRTEPVITQNRVITKQLERVLFVIEHGRKSELTPEVASLYSRLDDFLTGQTFYVISPDKSQHYESPFEQWGKVPEAFPSAMDAIEEAEKCFALGRNTACVFHCMAVMDKGLTALGRYLRTGINPDLDTWETIIGNIQGAITRKRTSMNKAAWKGVEAFYDEAVSDLRAVKNAWRNPTMHFRRTYTDSRRLKLGIGYGTS